MAGARDLSEELAAIDQEIGRLHEHAKQTPDVEVALYDQAMIDRLLEQRFALTTST